MAPLTPYGSPGASNLGSLWLPGALGAFWCQDGLVPNLTTRSECVATVALV